MSADKRRNSAKPETNPAALPLGDAAMLLTKLGGLRVTVEMLSADVEAGAPLNPDGTLNVLRYFAWLLTERNRGV